VVITSFPATLRLAGSSTASRDSSTQADGSKAAVRLSMMVRASRNSSV
jgi:hypothetical protein